MNQAVRLESSCEHCGSLFPYSNSQRFCCAGCEFVFGLIHAQGLDHYYRLREAHPPLCPVPVKKSSSSYEYCDDPQFVSQMSSDGQKLRFFLEGLNCTACLWLLEKLPEFCPAVQSSRVDMGASTIEVRRHPGASFAAIAQVLNRFGYRPRPLRETEATSHLQLRERRRELIRIGVAGVLTGNLMILAVSLYGGAAGTLAEEFRWLSSLLAFPVLTYGAWPFYQNTISSLRSGRLSLDVPIVIAILAGIFTSVDGLLRHSGTLYFDSLSMLVFLLLSSRFILKGIQGRHLRATNLEDEILLGSVQRYTASGQLETVSSLALAPQDVILISREGFIPADGIVSSGRGTISVSVLTGESEPLSVCPGMRVEAGSQNLSGEWTLTVTHPPGKTRLAQILRDTENSVSNKSSFVHFSDRVSQYFVALVLAGALGLVVYFLPSDPGEGLSRALALVIVTCPCVFGMAIPLSMTLAIRGAARKGIVVKNADALERLWNVKSLFFDKTGTLTKGEMSVLGVSAYSTKDLQVALGLERDQSHPVARALVRHLEKLGISAAEIQNRSSLTEGGVFGQFQGQSYCLKPVDSPVNDPDSALIQSTYGLFRGSEMLSVFKLGDEFREESGPFLSWVRQQGYLTYILSGDRSSVVRPVGQRLGFAPAEILSNMSPEDKAQEIEHCPQVTAMIGDGANDAMALAEASVGIAICGSLDTSLRAADVYLARANLNLVKTLFEISRRTRGTIYRNLFFSASFNIVSGTLAASGLMTPLWAAVLMPISSLTVVVSALWTGKKFVALGSPK